MASHSEGLVPKTKNEMTNLTQLVVTEWGEIKFLIKNLGKCYCHPRFDLTVNNIN